MKLESTIERFGITNARRTLLLLLALPGVFLLYGALNAGQSVNPMSNVMGALIVSFIPIIGILAWKSWGTTYVLIVYGFILFSSLLMSVFSSFYVGLIGTLVGIGYTAVTFFLALAIRNHNKNAVIVSDVVPMNSPAQSPVKMSSKTRNIITIILILLIIYLFYFTQQIEKGSSAPGQNIFSTLGSKLFNWETTNPSPTFKVEDIQQNRP